MENNKLTIRWMQLTIISLIFTIIMIDSRVREIENHILASNKMLISHDEIIQYLAKLFTEVIEGKK